MTTQFVDFLSFENVIVTAIYSLFQQFQVVKYS